MNTREIAWAAGLWEGEGSCGSQRGTSFKVNVKQKDRWILDRLVTLFGGTIAIEQGRISQHFRWNLCGPAARGFAFSIFTFLSPRRRAQLRRHLPAKRRHLLSPRGE